MCPDCYDYTGHVLFNACGPDLWRRFTIYLPRQLARLTGITQKALRAQVSVRFVKVAEYQARGLVHYHAIIRLDAPGHDYQPPPARYTAALLTDAIRARRRGRVPRHRRPPDTAQPQVAGTDDTAPFLSLVPAWRVPSDSGPKSTPGPSAPSRPARNRQRRYLPRPWRTTSPNTPPRPSALPACPTGPSTAQAPSPPCTAAHTTSGSSQFAGNWASTRRPRSSASTGGPTCSATEATSSPRASATPPPSPGSARPASPTAAPSGTPTARKTPGAATSTNAPSW